MEGKAGPVPPENARTHCRLERAHRPPEPRCGELFGDGLNVDRTRFLCWELIYPGDRTDPEYAAYYDRTMTHWDTLKVVVGEDIGIYEQLERTKQSSGYAEHILSSRECKLAMYHETMARKISE